MDDVRKLPELDRAIQILTPREHSVYELRLKLLQRSVENEKIDAIIAYLIELDYLSDERFAEAYVAERIRKGDGPIKISGNLRKRGISHALIEHNVSSDDEFWLSRAIDVLAKRFPSRENPALTLPVDEWVRRRKHLMNRGFPARVAGLALGDFRHV